MLGVGSGEALNEHVTGSRWPTADVRLGMLEEAVHVIRQLAARIGDGFVTTKPSADDIKLYRDNGGKGPVDAGVDTLFVAQLGPDQKGFFDFWTREIAPRWNDTKS